LGLFLLTINGVPPSRRSRGGYQLVFAGKGMEKHYVMAYHSQRELTIFPQGPDPDIVMRLNELIQKPSLWAKEEQHG
jgi:hypothetical protein